MNFTEVDRWYQDNGDNTLRLNYPLNENSIVFDCGGYKGDFADKIYNKYNCNVYIFEPYYPLYNLIVDRFSNKEKIKVYNYAIFDQTMDSKILYLDDASILSDVKTNDDNTKDEHLVRLKSFVEVYTELKINVIDLLKINVEGSEFNILQNVFDNNLQYKINNF
jgi:FkbM family methyltransferase